VEALKEIGLNTLLAKLEIDAGEKENVYHNAMLLLRIYSSAVWNTRDTADKLFRSCSETYRVTDIEGLECLISMYESNSVKKFETKLISVAQNKIMIDIVERSVLHVKEYPHYGDLYYAILNKNFFAEYPYTESEILEFLNISRSTYYRRRKEAIITFGISMWGYILPSILNEIKQCGETFLRQN